MHRSLLIAPALAGVLLTGAVVSAPAQDVKYTSVTRLQLEGAAGTAMRAAARLAGASLDRTETTYVKGNRMRVDDDDTSMIFDLEGGRFIILNHDTRTYTAMSFEDIGQLGQALAADAGAGADRAAAEPAPANDQPEVELDFRVSTQAAGERETVGGYPAERHFVTLEMESRGVDEDGEEVGGTLVVFTDLWLSTEVPGYRNVQELHELYAREVGASGFADALRTLLADSPEAAAAFEEAQRESAELEGMTVSSTSYIVSVPYDHTFDREAVLQPREGGAAQAARRGLRGLAARARAAAAEAEEEQEAEARQRTIIAATTELSEVDTSPLPESLFEIPEGYTTLQADAN